jgi:hypothetical protein
MLEECKTGAMLHISAIVGRTFRFANSTRTAEAVPCSNAIVGRTFRFANYVNRITNHRVFLLIYSTADNALM